MSKANECREVMVILFLIASIVCLFCFFQLRRLSQLCKSVSLNIISDSLEDFLLRYQIEVYNSAHTSVLGHAHKLLFCFVF